MTMRTITAKIAVAALFIMTLSCCTSKLLDSIKDDVDEQKLADIIAEQDGNTPETKKPTITVFQWVGGITTTNNPSVLFNIDAKANAVSASGPATLSAWYVSESLDVPAADDAKWSATQPTSYSFSCVNGKRTIYARVRDSLGNVSAAATLSVDLAPLGVDWNGSLVSGQEIAAHESLSFTARENLSASGITVSGTMGAGLATASGAGNAIVTVKPGAAGTGLWQAGSGTITVHCVTAYGLPLDATIALSPFNGVCVSTAGSDSNDGGVNAPYKTIGFAATKAYERFGSTPSVVRVEKGTYSLDSSVAAQQIALAGGVSVRGEYNVSGKFQTNTPTVPLSTVVSDTRSTNGTSTESSSVATVYLSGATSGAGVLYLRINGAAVDYCPLIQCLNSVALIEHCELINGGGTATAARYGIRVTGASAPTIRYNDINVDPSTGNPTGGSISVKYVEGIRVISCDGTICEISKNRLSGGIGSVSISGSHSVGIMCGLGSSSIRVFANRVISGSSITIYGVGTNIQCNAVLSAYNNLIECGKGDYSFGFFLASNSTYNPTYKIRNNSVILGAPGVSSKAEIGVSLFQIDSTDKTYIDNNLFLYFQGTQYTVFCGIYEATASVLFDCNNNALQGFQSVGVSNTCLYAEDDDNNPDNGFTEYDTITAFETRLQAEGSAVGSNFIPSPSLSFTGSEYMLSSKEASGLNGSLLGWEYTDDYNNKLRTGENTIGWSVGCYEKD